MIYNPFQQGKYSPSENPVHGADGDYYIAAYTVTYLDISFPDVTLNTIVS
jgi:hypothetical protein